jgi:hypothetical protein
MKVLRPPLERRRRLRSPLPSRGRNHRALAPREHRRSARPRRAARRVAVCLDGTADRTDASSRVPGDTRVPGRLALHGADRLAHRRRDGCGAQPCPRPQPADRASRHQTGKRFPAPHRAGRMPSQTARLRPGPGAGRCGTIPRERRGRNAQVPGARGAPPRADQRQGRSLRARHRRLRAPDRRLPVAGRRSVQIRRGRSTAITGRGLRLGGKVGFRRASTTRSSAPFRKTPTTASRVSPSFTGSSPSSRSSTTAPRDARRRVRDTRPASKRNPPCRTGGGRRAPNEARDPVVGVHTGAQARPPAEDPPQRPAPANAAHGREATRSDKVLQGSDSPTSETGLAAMRSAGAPSLLRRPPSRSARR